MPLMSPPLGLSLSLPRTLRHTYSSAIVTHPCVHLLVGGATPHLLRVP